MNKLLLFVVALSIFGALSAAHAADWSYDYRRCAAGREAGDFYVRISTMIGFDIIRKSDLHVVDFKVASVRVDGVDFPARLAGWIQLPHRSG